MDEMKMAPRSKEEKENLRKRLNKISGQVNGIAAMIEGDRYCGEVLIQLEATEAALKQVEYIILKTHMETCVREKILKGDDKVIDETFELIKNLK